MLNKVLAKELETFREKLSNLKKRIKEATHGRQQKDEEYALKQSEFKKESRRHMKTINKQDLKLSTLDVLIQDLEMKLHTLLDELGEVTLSVKEDDFELSKVNEERTETKKTNDRIIAELKDSIKEAKEDLRQERKLEWEGIKAHEAMMKNVENEFRKKLNEAQRFWSNRYKIAEQKYKATEEPLLQRIQCLDYEIEAIENAILAKPKELEDLKSKNELLNKKLQKVTALRYLYETKITIRSLEEALRFVEKQAGSVDKGLILGVLIAKANLQWIASILKYRSPSKVWTDALEHLLRQCNHITESNAFNVPILKKHIWESSAGDLKSGVLKEADNDFVLPEFDSCQAIDTYMMNGTPEDSDLCINELINSSCNISETCWLSEINGDYHSGYKTSHRLLYFQIADRMECEQKNPKKFYVIKAVKNKLCQRMLLEAKALSEESHFFLTQDLFMEQIALCGLEGHEEFALEIWRSRVRNWQSHEGCFGQDFMKNCSNSAYNKNYHTEQVKQSEPNTYGCHTHVTAVAIPTLAFFLRVTLKAAFKLILA